MFSRIVWVYSTIRHSGRSQAAEDQNKPEVSIWPQSPCGRHSLSWRRLRRLIWSIHTDHFIPSISPCSLPLESIPCHPVRYPASFVRVATVKSPRIRRQFVGSVSRKTPPVISGLQCLPYSSIHTKQRHSGRQIAARG